VVAGLAGLVDLFGVAGLPFYTKGEPREAVVVWEMAHDGGLVLPMRNGDEVPSKPPLFHWLGLASSAVLGEVSELSVRLPSALLAIATTLAIYAFAASVSRIRCGWLAAIALAFSFEWLRAARTARVDMTFSALLAGALLLFAIMDRFGATRARRVAFYAALAGATLTKGPVGLLLPMIVILVYAAASPDPAEDAPRGLLARLRETLMEIRALPGLVAVVALCAVWYGAAWAVGGNDFLETHALRENVFRVLDADRYSSGHSHGLFYLFGQFFLGAFPWSLSAPAIAWWLWRGRPLDDTHRFLVVWLVVVFVFFSIPDSKRGVYLLPAYPAAALLFGLVLGPGPEGGAPRRLAAAGWLIGCFVLGLLGLAALIVASGLPFDELVLSRLRPHEAFEVAASLAALRDHALSTAAMGALVLIASAAAAANAPGAHWLRASVPLVVALTVTLGGLVAPVERAIARSRSLAPFLPRVKAEIREASLAFGDGSFDYGAVFYAGRRIPRDETSRASADYLLVFETRDGSAPEGAEVVLRSAGTGPRGRSRLLLVRNDGSRSNGPRASADRSAGH